MTAPTITTVATAEDTVVSDGTGRSVIVAVVGSGQLKWGALCFGSPCKVQIIGYARRSQAERGAAWHLKWHRNGEPTCSDCGAELGRKGSKHCPPGRCEDMS